MLLLVVRSNAAFLDTTPHVITNVTIVTSYNSASVNWLPGYDGGYPQHFIIWFVNY